MSRAPSELRARLMLPETRSTAVRSVIEAYRATRSHKGAAKVLDVPERTFKRIVADDPSLAKLLQVERARWDHDARPTKGTLP